MTPLQKNQNTVITAEVILKRKKLKEKSGYQLEKILDRWFSYFIRLRDSNFSGTIYCCTCNRPFYWKAADCGHYSKRNKAHRFNEKNCNAQCKHCNDKLKGEADKHAIFIDKKYGEGTANFLRSTESQIKKLSTLEYLELIKEYKQKAKIEASLRNIKIYDSIP